MIEARWCVNGEPHLAGEVRPGIRTINLFRERQREDLSALLVETVRIAKGFGLAKLGRLAIDEDGDPSEHVAVEGDGHAPGSGN